MIFFVEGNMVTTNTFLKWDTKKPVKTKKINKDKLSLTENALQNNEIIICKISLNNNNKN